MTTDPLGRQDGTPPDNVPIHHVAGTQHLAGRGAAMPKSICAPPPNPVDAYPVLRAVTLALIPFARTKTEREAKGDPRRALDEPYRDEADYVDKVRAAAVALQGTGYLLSEDVERIVEQAAATAW